MRHRAQRLHFHRTAQRDIVGAAAGNFLCCRAAGRQRVVQVDIDFQAFCADGNLFHFLCGGDPSFGQQPPQRQLRQKLGCAYHPEGRLFIDIDNGGVFCWNGRFRAVRHPYGFKGGCCAEEVDSLHGGPFSAHWGRGSCLMSGLGVSQSPAFERKESSPLIRCAPPDGLRLLIFLQPLGRALKNQNAAPTAPPCFSRRCGRRCCCSSPLIRW